MMIPRAHRAESGRARRVPRKVVAHQLFGGGCAEVGWFLIIFSSLFMWIFVPAADFAGLVHFRGALDTSVGAVTEARKTRFTVGGSDNSDGTPVYEYTYTFEVDGEGFEGVSYATGSRSSVGAQVTVEYPPGAPARSRLRGMRSKPLGVGALFVLIFPLVGAAMIGFRVRSGRRVLDLLGRGMPADGVLDRKRATNTEINDRRVYELTYLFEAADGSVHEVSAKTHKPAALEDGVTEPLVYDPADPSRATLLDHLPGRPEIGGDTGAVRLRKSRSWFRLMVLPAVAVVGNAVYAVVRWL